MLCLAAKTLHSLTPLRTYLILDGNWAVVHSLALFEEEDVLCLSDRENSRIECVRAGVGPVRSNPAINPNEEDATGAHVVTYKNVGKTYAIAPKGVERPARLEEF